MPRPIWRTKRQAHTTKHTTTRRLTFQRLEDRMVLTGPELDLVTTCGAAGDGVTDDHAALQTCIGLLPQGGIIHVPQGRFLINGSVFLGDNISLEGTGEGSRFLLNTDLRSPDDPHGFWFNLGVKQRADMGVPYQGRLLNLRFEILADASLQAGIAIHSGDGFAIHNNVFDARAASTSLNVSWIHALPTSVYRQGGTGAIRHGTIFNNAFYSVHAEGTGEQITLGIAVEDLTIADNDFRGSNSSCVGVHGANHIVVAGNRCESSRRGIAVFGGSDVTIANNHIQRTANAAGDWVVGGELIVADSTGLSKTVERLVVTNNTLVNPIGSRATYGIRLRGVKDGVVSDNQLETHAVTYVPGNDLDLFYGLILEPRPIAGGVINIESIVIQSNTFYGSEPAVMWQFGDRANGPLMVQSNVASGFQFYGESLLSDNQLNGSLAQPIRVEDRVAQSELLFEGLATDLASGQSALAEDIAGQSVFSSTMPFRITRIEVTPDAETSAGRLLPTIQKPSGDFLPPRGAYNDTDTTFGYQSPFHYNTPTVVPGENVVVMLTASEDFSGNGVSAVVRVYGVGMDTVAQDPVRPHLRTGSVSQVDEQWQTVTLDREYTSPVVVATVHNVAANPPLVTRLRNVGGQQFELRVQPMASGVTLSTPVTVSYVIVEEGVYTRADHGVTLEAHRIDSPPVDRGTLLVGSEQSFVNPYHEPVVVGQVMTSVDARPSVFWASGATQDIAPKRGELRIGSHVGDDSVTDRFTESLAYIVVESSSGQIEGTSYVADVISATDLTSKGTPTLLPLLRTNALVATQGGLSGADSSWAVVVEDEQQMRVGIDEDRWQDHERAHPPEMVSYLEFGERLPRRQQSQRVTVDVCGAVGDGVTNNAGAFQACIDIMPPGGTLYVPEGVYRVDGQIYVPSDINLVGTGPDSVLELNTDLVENDPTGYGFWWNFGLGSRGSVGRFYSGEVHDLTFRLTSSARTFRALEYHTADTIAIYRNLFDGSNVTTNVPTSWISTQIVGAYQTAKHHQTKKNGVIANNRFILNQTEVGGEQIGLGGFADNFVVANNIMTGAGDDCVGLHSTRMVVVAGNACSSVDGRLLVEKGVGTVFVDNELTRMADINGNWGPYGAFIHANAYGSSHHGFSNSRDTVIAYNRITNPAQSQTTYGIRLVGTTDAVVAGNVIETDSVSRTSGGVADAFLAIVVQEQSGSNAQLSANVTLANNQVTGAVNGSIQMNGSKNNGPILVHENAAARFQFYGDSMLGDNQTNGASPDLRVAGSSFLRDELLFEGRVSNVGANDAQTAELTIGGFAFPIVDPSRITRIEVIPSTPPASGRLWVRVIKPGGGEYLPDVASINDTELTFGYQSHFYFDESNLSPGDIELEVMGSDDLLDELDAIVRVFTAS